MGGGGSCSLSQWCCSRSQWSSLTTSSAVMDVAIRDRWQSPERQMGRGEKRLPCGRDGGHAGSKAHQEGCFPPWHFCHWRPCQKGQMVECKGRDGRTVLPWVTSHYPNCDMKLMSLSAPSILRDASRGISQASPGLSCLLVPPLTVHRTFQKSATSVMGILRPRKVKRFFLLLFLTMGWEYVTLNQEEVEFLLWLSSSKPH